MCLDEESFTFGVRILSKAAAERFEPRKTPLQARSTASVEAIMQATIQVLLKDGKVKLTTTRIADRAGVSVGTLYQYFPNKQAIREVQCIGSRSLTLSKRPMNGTATSSQDT